MRYNEHKGRWKAADRHMARAAVKADTADEYTDYASYDYNDFEEDDGCDEEDGEYENDEQHNAEHEESGKDAEPKTDQHGNSVSCGAGSSKTAGDPSRSGAKDETGESGVKPVTRTGQAAELVNMNPTTSKTIVTCSTEKQASTANAAEDKDGSSNGVKERHIDATAIGGQKDVGTGADRKA